MPLDVQSLLLNAGAVLLNSTLLFKDCRLSPQSCRLLLLLQNLRRPLAESRHVPHTVHSPLVLFQEFIEVAHDGNSSSGVTGQAKGVKLCILQSGAQTAPAAHRNARAGSLRLRRPRFSRRDRGPRRFFRLTHACRSYPNDLSRARRYPIPHRRGRRRSRRRLPDPWRGLVSAVSRGLLSAPVCSFSVSYLRTTSVDGAPTGNRTPLLGLRIPCPNR